MVKIENFCCNCAVPGYPCMGSSCPNRNVEVHYCDKCGDKLDNDDIYEDENGYELCECCREETED